jgi:tRNA threonylcarbamoyladenosine modification (KEOPS) complex  Pcc1 subunit
MKYSTTIVIPKKLKIPYLKALGSMKEHKRSGISIKETDQELRITIQTEDITALRASVNAVIRDISVIEAAK